MLPRHAIEPPKYAIPYSSLTEYLHKQNHDRDDDTRSCWLHRVAVIVSPQKYVHIHVRTIYTLSFFSYLHLETTSKRALKIHRPHTIRKEEEDDTPVPVVGGKTGSCRHRRPAAGALPQPATEEKDHGQRSVSDLRISLTSSGSLTVTKMAQCVF